MSKFSVVVVVVAGSVMDFMICGVDGYFLVVCFLYFFYAYCGFLCNLSKRIILMCF